MPDAGQTPADDVARAERAHAAVADEWMQFQSVRGVMVGALRDERGGLTSRVGLIVLADVESVQAVSEELPGDVDGTPVQVVPGSPEPQGFA